MQDELLQLKSEAEQALEACSTMDELESFRIKYLGRKGLFSGLMRELGKVPKEERPALGQLANTVKNELETLHKQRRKPSKARVPRPPRARITVCRAAICRWASCIR